MNRRVRRSNGARQRWYREQHRTRSLERTIRNAVAYGLLDGSPAEEARIRRMTAAANALEDAYRAAARGATR